MNSGALNSGTTLKHAATPTHPNQIERSDDPAVARGRDVAVADTANERSPGGAGAT